MMFVCLDVWRRLAMTNLITVLLELALHLQDGEYHIYTIIYFFYNFQYYYHYL